LLLLVVDFSKTSDSFERGRSEQKPISSAADARLAYTGRAYLP